MDYQTPPAPAPQFCVRQMSASAIPGRYFIAFNDDEANFYDQGAYEYLTIIVPQCPLGLITSF